MVLMQSRIRAWAVRGKRRRSETQMRLMALRCQAAWASRLQRVRLRLELEQRRQAAQVLGPVMAGHAARRKTATTKQSREQAALVLQAYR